VNRDVEARSPIFGKGMMPEDRTVNNVHGWSGLEKWVEATYLSETARLTRRASMEELRRQ
jgi:hypothetical protein